MRSAIHQPIARGFTLVELLIVVIILAILAAIVVPQFSATTTDAQESALDANLAAMRSAIELYKAQHNGVYPGDNAANGGTCAATKGTGTAGTAQSFMDQLLMASDANGNTCSVADTTFKFGPYLRKGIPADPIKKKGSVVGEIAVTTTGVPIAPSADTGGWAYDTKSGQIVMNSNAQDSSKSKLFSAH
jgi:general secretion pathway protein G